MSDGIRLFSQLSWLTVACFIFGIRILSACMCGWSGPACGSGEPDGREAASNFAKFEEEGKVECCILSFSHAAGSPTGAKAHTRVDAQACTGRCFGLQLIPIFPDHDFCMRRSKDN